MVKTCTYTCNGTSKYTAQLFRERERKKEESLNGLHEPASDGDSEIYYDSGPDLEVDLVSSHNDSFDHSLINILCTYVDMYIFCVWT